MDVQRKQEGPVLSPQIRLTLPTRDVIFLKPLYGGMISTYQKLYVFNVFNLMNLASRDFLPSSLCSATAPLTYHLTARPPLAPQLFLPPQPAFFVSETLTVTWLIAYLVSPSAPGGVQALRAQGHSPFAQCCTPST